MDVLSSENRGKVYFEYAEARKTSAPKGQQNEHASSIIRPYTKKNLFRSKSMSNAEQMNQGRYTYILPRHPEAVSMCQTDVHFLLIK